MAVKLVKLEHGHQIGMAWSRCPNLTSQPFASPVVTQLGVQNLEGYLLANGSIKFDIDAGQVISKELEWDETVVGFNGPSSNMEYLGRITESLVSEDRVASKK